MSRVKTLTTLKQDEEDIKEKIIKDLKEIVNSRNEELDQVNESLTVVINQREELGEKFFNCRKQLEENKKLNSTIDEDSKIFSKTQKIKRIDPNRLIEAVKSKYLEK